MGCSYRELVSPGELCRVEGAAPAGEGDLECASREDERREETDVKEFVEEGESGARVPLKAADPRLPSAEEVEAHNLTHFPTGHDVSIASGLRGKPWTTGARVKRR